MRIGLNLLYLLPTIVGGTETYAAGLIDGLYQMDNQNEYIIFLNQAAADWQLPTKPNFTRFVCPITGFSRLQRYYYEQINLPRLVRQQQIDLLHSLGYVAPIRLRCPSVVTIHDLNYQAFGPQMPVKKRATLAFFIHQSARHADRIITPSYFSREQIIHSYKDVPADRIVVVEEAVRERPPLRMSPEQARTELERYGLRQPYLMALGNRGANKNIPRLIEAFKKARKQYGISHQLVIAGHLSAADLRPYTKDLDETALVITGYLEDFSLRVLLEHASVFIVASTYEGFGLTVLEAMAADVPVVSSNAASLPEVCGNAAVLFNPFSIDDMAAKIASVANDKSLQDHLRQLGWVNIDRFSWAKAATQTLNVYHEVVGFR